MKMVEDNPVFKNKNKKIIKSWLLLVPEYSLFENASENAFSILKSNGVFFHGRGFGFNVGIEKRALCYLSYIAIKCNSALFEKCI